MFTWRLHEGIHEATGPLAAPSVLASGIFRVVVAVVLTQKFFPIFLLARHGVVQGQILQRSVQFVCAAASPTVRVVEAHREAVVGGRGRDTVVHVRDAILIKAGLALTMRPVPRRPSVLHVFTAAIVLVIVQAHPTVILIKDDPVAVAKGVRLAAGAPMDRHIMALLLVVVLGGCVDVHHVK